MPLRVSARGGGRAAEGGAGRARAPRQLQPWGLSLEKFVLGAECGRVGVKQTRLVFPRVKTGKFRAEEPTQKTGECLQSLTHPYRT